MLRRHPAAAADRGAEQQRKIHLTAEHVMDFRGLIDDLVHRDKAERNLPPIDDRAEAAAGRADADAGKGGLGDRRRFDPGIAELSQQRADRVGGHVEDLRSRRISSAIASRAASLYVSSRIIGSPPQETL